ncbi:MAG: arylsulfatase [Breznakibacter sp.]
MYNKILLMTAFAATFAVQAQKRTTKNGRPNIVLILADDLGYSDIGAYGSEIQTPNLDKLASEGVRVRQFYNNSISAPTRASLLTGQYQHSAGVGDFAYDLGLPAYQGYINNQSLTLAEVLKSAGYSTLFSGKWHVSGNNVSQPWQRGFDRYLLANNGSYFDQGDYNGGKKTPYVLDGDPYPLEPDSYYVTDVITEKAVGFIDDAAKTNKPFFLYLSYTAPHWPLHARSEDVAKYKGRYDGGWEKLRQERYAKQKKLGVVEDGHVISKADDDVYDWERLSYDQKQQWTHKMEVYAAMVDRLDQGIGRVLNRLAELKLDENTLIVFLSDNGAPAEDMIKWHGGALRNTGPVGTIGSFESQGKNWSYASNTPFKAYKDYLYEGGIRTPFIARLPGRIRPGSFRNGTGHIIDLAPTFYELAQAKYPATYNGTKTLPLAGKSLTNVLFGIEDLVDRPVPLFWERAGNRAVRDGKWKLVSHHPSLKWELYDLEADAGETTNVAGKYPLVVDALSVKYFEWGKANHVENFFEIEDRQPESLKKFRLSKVQDATR